MQPLVRIGSALTIACALTLGGVIGAQAALPLRTKACGAVVKRSFRLANDLTCTGDGLKVRKAGITIDLNGKTVEGDGGANDFVIDNTASKDDVTIRNGTVTNFDDGVKIGAAAARNVVRKVTVFSNTFDGIDIDGGRGHQLIRNIAFFNGENGIEMSARRSLVKTSASRENTLDGIHVEGPRNRVVFNTSKENLAVGISVTGNLNTVRDNVACGNGTFNFAISGAGNDVGNNQEVCP